MKDSQGNELTRTEIVKKAGNRASSILLEAELFLLRITDYIPSHIIRRAFQRLAGITIGAGSSIHMGLVVYNPRGISVGRDSIVGEKATLDGRGTLTIGDHVALASEVMIYNSQHDVHDDHFSPITKSVTIGDYAFIGPRAIILPGVSVGRGGVVAAGAVVTKDVEEMSIVAGVPAVPIGKRKLDDPKYKIGRASWFR
jgi:maltose O-acetyltransferase